MYLLMSNTGMTTQMRRVYNKFRCLSLFLSCAGLPCSPSQGGVKGTSGSLLGSRWQVSLGFLRVGLCHQS